MTKAERLRAAIRGEAVDRVPVSFWRHFPDRDADPTALAEALIAFHREYDLDLIKVMPTGPYCVEDWGCRVVYRGSVDGSREVVGYAVQAPADWDRIEPLDSGQGALGRELSCVEQVRRLRSDDAPILQTIFSPLTIVKKLGGAEVFRRDLRAEPERIRRVLAVVTATMTRYALESLKAGADGIFFATQVAVPDLVSADAHREFAEPYDRSLLDTVRGAGGMTILHAHGLSIFFEVLATYPVDGINWHDRRTTPALAEARRSFPGLLVGGVNEASTLRGGDAEAARLEVRDAVRQTGGRGHLVAPGCVVPLDAKPEVLRAVRDAVEGGP
ncbi:MAG: uroporphyrinogen decarboxylase family protein [Candidatus Methylomirabilales bacterium]